MMKQPMASDPRVFFAAERTLLAWVRTGLTIMAFGFVVARFGLFLRLLAAQHVAVAMPTASRTDFSNLAGIALVLVGTACMLLGAAQHRSYVATLPPADVPRSHAPIYPILLALFLAALGLALAAYLAA
jgi:putative membrane protein